VFAVRATDEAGNTGPTASVSWVVSQPLPDLVVSSLTGTSVTVTNVGGGAAGAFVIRVVPGGTFTVGGLAPGGSTTRTFSCVEGAISAVADSGAQVAEASEGNNTASITNIC
jgi:subtilase family serine protease